MKELRGKANVFKFIGTYDAETETFTVAVPEGTEDFVFEVDDEGICFVETNQKFNYDPETGNFYFIQEVD